MKKLPKNVFVYWKEFENDDPSLYAVEKAGDALEGELGCVRVGRYELVEQSDVQAVPIILPPKSSR